jgi:hypothetical protein
MTHNGNGGKVNGHRLRRMADMTLCATWLGQGPDADPRETERRRTPGVDGVVSALTGPNRSVDALETALHALAWERASDPDGLDAALEDLDALWAVLESGGLDPVPRRRARAWLVDGWVDALAAERSAPCIDPLSGLHTAAYLVARIHELDRLADDSAVPLVLLAVRWAEPPSPWDRIATILTAARTLHEHVRPEATVSREGTATVLALVPDDARARVERAALALSCAQRPLADAGALADLIPVPDRRDLVPGVVRGLRVDAPERRPTAPRPEDPSRVVD